MILKLKPIFMTSKRLNSYFERIYQHFKNDETRNFFIKRIDGNFSNGILTREMARNWHKEWWKYNVAKQNKALAYQQVTKSPRDKTIHEMLEFYIKIANVPSDHFIVATVNKDDNFSINCCLFSKSTHRKHKEFVDEWSLRQVTFFKKYFYNPSCLNHIKEHKNNEINNKEDNNFMIMYMHDENKNDKILIEKSTSQTIRSSLFKGNVHVTVVNIDLFNLCSSSILDAQIYRDKLSKRRSDAKLMFHNRLAPIKIYVESQTEKPVGDIPLLVKEIAAMLRTKNICVWDNKQFNIDEIGIPFTLIVPDNVADTGIVFLHDVNTGINMQVTVPQIDSKVIKHLHL